MGHIEERVLDCCPKGLSSFLTQPLTYWVILAKPFTILALGLFLCEMKIVGNVTRRAPPGLMF